MAQSFTCENLHSYLFWIHTHCTCIKLYKLPLDQKTGLQKNRYKTPMKSLPPPFFPLPNFFSVKRKGQPGVSKKNLWCGIRIPMYRPVNKGCGLQSLKIYNFSLKKKYISWNIKSQPKFVNDLRIRMSDRWNAWMCIIM